MDLHENYNIPIGFSVAMISDVEGLHANDVVDDRNRQNVKNEARSVIHKEEFEAKIEKEGTFPL